MEYQSEDAIKTYPLDPSLLAILASAEYMIGDKSEALTTAQRLFEYEPTQENLKFIKQIESNNFILPQP